MNNKILVLIVAVLMAVGGLSLYSVNVSADSSDSFMNPALSLTVADSLPDFGSGGDIVVVEGSVYQWLGAGIYAFPTMNDSPILAYGSTFNQSFSDSFCVWYEFVSWGSEFYLFFGSNPMFHTANDSIDIMWFMDTSLIFFDSFEVDSFVGGLPANGPVGGAFLYNTSEDVLNVVEFLSWEFSTVENSGWVLISELPASSVSIEEGGEGVGECDEDFKLWIICSLLACLFCLFLVVVVKAVKS